MSRRCLAPSIPCVFAICCAVLTYAVRVQAQLPKSPDEIEAEIVEGHPTDAPANAMPAPAEPTPAGQGRPYDHQGPHPPAPASSAPAPIVKTPNVELWPTPVPAAPGHVAPHAEMECDGRCQAIDVELAELTAEKRRTALFLPIFGMVAGYGGAALLTSASIDNSLGEDNARIAGLAVGAAGMLGVGIASHVWLLARVERRRSIQRRMKALMFEKGMSFGTPEMRARMVRVAAIDEELVGLRGEYARYSLTAPIVVMSAGFGVSAPLFAIGMLMLAFGGGEGGAFVLGGAAAAGVGVGGALWLGHRKRLRKPVGDRIRELQREQRLFLPVSFDVQVHPNNARLVLQWRF